MELDDVGRGVVAGLLTGQVDSKTGLAYRLGWAVVLAGLAIAVAADSWLRWLAALALLIGLVFLLFVVVSKRSAKAVINRIGPPIDVDSSQVDFAAAFDEADLPSGPVSLLRLIWRLRNGVGPEIDRLGGVVSRLRSDLDGGGSD